MLDVQICISLKH